MQRTVTDGELKLRSNNNNLKQYQDDPFSMCAEN